MVEHSLFNACIKGYIAKKYLVKHGAISIKKDNNGQTSLIITCSKRIGSYSKTFYGK